MSTQPEIHIGKPYTDIRVSKIDDGRLAFSYQKGSEDPLSEGTRTRYCGGTITLRHFLSGLNITVEDCAKALAS